jgi:hypothetical protein
MKQNDLSFNEYNKNGFSKYIKQIVEITSFIYIKTVLEVLSIMHNYDKITFKTLWQKLDK